MKIPLMKKPHLKFLVIGWKWFACWNPSKLFDLRLRIYRSNCIHELNPTTLCWNKASSRIFGSLFKIEIPFFGLNCIGKPSLNFAVQMRLFVLRLRKSGHANRIDKILNSEEPLPICDYDKGWKFSENESWANWCNMEKNIHLNYEW